MRRRHIMAMTLMLALAAAAPASADDMFNNTHTYHTKAGQEVQIGRHAYWDRRCQPRPPPPIVIAQPPQHGAITFRPGTYIAKGSIGSVSCDGREVTGVYVFYTPAAGFTGADALIYKVTYGAEILTRTITVVTR